MRLEKLIAEADAKRAYEEVMTNIERDCQPFLKQSDRVYYRGSNSANVAKMIQFVRPRSNRRPKDMPQHVHDALDKSFKKYFGWKVRSEGVFAGDRTGVIGQYGSLFLFFPIGKFKYVYSPYIKDLYMHINDKISGDLRFHADPDNDKLEKHDTDLLDELVRTEYEDKGLSGHIDGVEVSFYCPNGYYMVDYAMVNMIKKRFNL